MSEVTEPVISQPSGSAPAQECFLQLWKKIKQLKSQNFEKPTILQNNQFSSPLFYCDPGLCVKTIFIPCMTFHSTQTALDKSKAGSRTAQFCLGEIMGTYNSTWTWIPYVFCPTLPNLSLYLNAIIIIGGAVSTIVESTLQIVDSSVLTYSLL